MAWKAVRTGCCSHPGGRLAVTPWVLATTVGLAGAMSLGLALSGCGLSGRLSNQGVDAANGPVRIAGAASPSADPASTVPVEPGIGTTSPSATPPALAVTSSPPGDPLASDPVRDGERVPTGTPVTIAFGGDVHFEGSVGERLAADPRSMFGSIAQTLGRADLAMVNLETAVTTRGTPTDKKYVFRAPPSAFNALQTAGIDIATLANNHGMDYGLDGLYDTLAGARAASFPVVGIGTDDTAAYAPARVTVHGQRIAIVGATQVIDDELMSAWTSGPGKPGLASAKNVPRLLKAVRAARQDSDTVIVYLHWGVERQSCPTQAQQSLVPQLVAAGADVVVGAHAHVLLGGGWQPGGAYVDYGLGNFAFYSSGNGPNTASGVLTLTVAGRAITAAEWTPARIVGGVPQPLAGTGASAARAEWHRLRACAELAAGPPPRVPAHTGRRN
ncbi:CapA family protein [Protofrankia symbiont of Coriaria ruscifolia]|uniref:CapA family protein n=1 Tax=Protofrankia symbiont of Coriaria ruscifolia TaxID=1306542 RepID=UPI001F5FB572|nr:CapA family protein [Protofrankia symbiont of Coriaria ruscifolia]